MKIMKINTKISLFIFALISLSYFYGCVDAESTPPGEVKKINISYPVTGDTVYTGKNIIILNTPDPGIGQYEIFVEGQSVGLFPKDSTLYFTVSQYAIGSKVEYYINGYYDNGGLAQSEKQKVYVTGSPRPPTNLSLSTFNEHEILLFWSDNADNETSYEVWRSVGNNHSYGGEPYRVLLENSNNFRDAGLDQYTAYYYKVCAVNGYGRSKFSNEVSSNGESGRDAPTNLKAEALGNSAVLLTWKDNSLTENGFLVKMTLIDANGNYGEWVTAAVYPPNTEEAIIDGLLPSTAYAFQVFALLQNNQPGSNIATVVTGTSYIPAPSNLVADFDMDERAVKLTWNDNTTLEYGTEIQRKIYGSDDVFESLTTTEPDQTLYYDRNYLPGLTYVYRVRYVTASGTYSMFSNQDTAYVPLLPPKPPTNLDIEELNPGTAFLLTWEDNSQDETHFEIWRATKTTDYALYRSLDANTTNYTVTGLNRDTVYYFKVRAVNNTLASSFSNEVRTLLVAPTNFTASVTSTPTVVLTWTDNSSNEGWFEIYRRYTGGGEFERIGVVAPNVTSYTDDEVNRGTAYDYKIRAASEESVSNFTDILTVQIPSKK